MVYNKIHIAERGSVARQLLPSPRGRFAVPRPSDRNALRNSPRTTCTNRYVLV